MSAAILNVCGVYKKSTELSYDDLCWLYNDFISNYGHVPLTSECLSKNNLPQSRIINKIIELEGITYNDFICQFGKTSHVSANIKNYDKYVYKYKMISNEKGHALTEKELTNNNYGLPSASWFCKNCPDDTIQSYDDFVRWCGFKSNTLKKEKDVISKQLLKL